MPALTLESFGNASSDAFFAWFKAWMKVVFCNSASVSTKGLELAMLKLFLGLKLYSEVEVFLRRRGTVENCIVHVQK